VREVENRGLGSGKKSSTCSQSPIDVAKNKKTKKMGKASEIWSKPGPAPEAMAMDNTSSRAIRDRTANAHIDRPGKKCRFALRITSDSTEGVLPFPKQSRMNDKWLAHEKTCNAP
jgi:hypothetical protein